MLNLGKARNILILLFFVATVSWAQENCSNGIDDDGDGFVDCYDGECAGSADCGDFFFGTDGLCETPPTAFPTFSIRLGWGSDDRTATSMNRPTVGDLDGDGIPEVISSNRWDDIIYVLDGRDGSVKHSRTVAGSFYPGHNSESAIADIDRDGLAEIFMMERGSGNRISAYSHDLSSVIWSKNLPESGEFLFSLADFDGDGLVEIYYMDKIIDAETGITLADAGGGTGNTNFGSVAADILPDSVCTNCDGLELIVGGKIFSVDLGSRTAGSGNLNLERSHPDYYIKRRSLTSIADYNQDGSLDVLANGATGSHNGTTAIFFWDVANNTMTTYEPPNNWGQGTGRLNVADLDNDGNLNVAFVSGSFLYALDHNLNFLWRSSITEGTSGFTSTTVFDFNGDGASEIIYRDEQNLYVVDGTTGGFNRTITCKSRTSLEYPVVADVDGDGATEICVACMTDDADDMSSFANAQRSHIRVYESDGESWAPTRKIWNQSSYFNVNVNDDLTIPIEQQQHHLVWSSGVCSAGDNRPLNTFLNQSPYLDENGCPIYSSPDLSFISGSLSVSEPLCPETDFNVDFQIQNTGDVPIAGSLPISFYDGDPTTAGAVLLNTVSLSLSNLRPDSIRSLSAIVNGSGGEFELFIVVNNNGTSSPPIDLTDVGIVECDYTNNIASTRVSPFPNDIFTELLRPNVKCVDSLANNGAARAYVQESGAETTTGYTFYWYNDSTDFGGTPDFTGSTNAGLDSGTYFVYAVNDAAGCSSDTGSVYIPFDTESLDSLISFEVIDSVTSCDVPNGTLDANILGDAATNYTFTWYLGNDVLIDGSYISTGNRASNLDASTYSVYVQSLVTGCVGAGQTDVPSDIFLPSISIDNTEDVFNCLTPNEGEILASAGGFTAGYTFEWYNSDTIESVPDFSPGNLYDSLMPGQYTVRATVDSTGCTSPPTTITIADNRDLPTIDSAFVIEINTACDPALANGVLGGTAEGGNVEPTYEFEWFSGSSTLPSQLVADSSVATGLEEGTYTVQVTEVATGCAATDEVDLDITTTDPTLTITKIRDNTSCRAPNGELEGRVNGVQAGYTFYWFEGRVNNPDTADADFIGPIFRGLDRGIYTAIAKDDLTGCISSRSESEVIQNNQFSVTAVGEINNQSCDAADPRGALTAIHTSPDPTSVFRYIWIRGGAGSTDTIATTFDSTYVGLAAGSYNVIVEDTTTGCSDKRQASLNSDPFNVNLKKKDLTTTAQTTCNPPNGSAEVLRIFEQGDEIPLSNFYFYLVDTNTNDTLVNRSEDSVFTNLPAGDDYELIVIHKVFKCETQMKTFPSIVADTPTVSVTVTSIDNTACDSLLANGSVTATGASTGASETFDYFWQTGQTFDGTDTLTTGATASNLWPGDYAVKTVGQTTGCQNDNSNYGTVGNAPVIPTLMLSDITTIPRNHCTDTNGSITINAVEENSMDQDTADYIFNLYDASGALLDTASTATFNGLDSGDYRIEAISQLTGCSTSQVDVRIEYAPLIPVLNAAATANTVCDLPPGNGSVYADPTTGGSPSGMGYSFAWTDSIGGSIGTTDSLTGLLPGDYQVLIIDLSNQCVDSATVTVNDNPVVPVLNLSDAVVSPQTLCSPFDGSIVINSVEENGSPADTGNFYFTYYQSDGTTLIDSDSSASLSGLAAGDYFVAATQLGGGCTSALLPFTIDNDAVRPLANLSAVANTSCDTTNAPNGSVISNPTTGGAASASGYQFTWYDGSDTTAAIYSSTNDTLFNVAPGDVTVLVTDNANNCSRVATLPVNDNPLTPSVADADITIAPQSFCDPVNGSITINSVIENSIPQDTSNYVFALYASNGTSLLDSGTVANFQGLDSGTYYIEATHISRSCVSAKNQVLVNYTAIRPRPNFTVTENSACNTNFNGAIEVDPTTDGSTSAGGYTYHWFDGADTTATERSETTDSIGGIAPGDYTILIRDMLTGCVRASTTPVDSIPSYPSLLAANITTTPQTHCANPDGTITVNDVLEGGSSMPLSDYTFYLFEDTATFPLLDSASLAFSELAFNDYLVRAVSDVTGCSSTSRRVAVADGRVFPLANIAITDQTSCDTLQPNGQLAADALGSDPFSYSWYNGDRPVSGAPADSDSIYTNLNQGFYSLRLRNQSTQCLADTSVYLPESITYPTLTLTPSAQVNCGPADGQILASPSYGTVSDYTFTWYNGSVDDPDSVITGQTSNILDSLEFGIYTVTAVNNANFCRAVADTTVVADSIAETIFSLDVVAAALGACDGNTGSLGVSATVDDPSATTVTFDYTWYQGTLPINDGQDSISQDLNVNAGDLSQISNLTAGSYSVLAVNSFNGCEAGRTYQVPFEDDHELVVTDVQGVRSCGPNNTPGSDGFFEVTLDSLPSADPGDDFSEYFYTLYQGTTVDAANILMDSVSAATSGTDTVTFSNLSAGFYTVVAYQNFAPGCGSLPVTVQIRQEALKPLVSIDSANSDFVNKYCVGGDAFLAANAVNQLRDSVQSGSFTYRWFTGTDTTTFREQAQSIDSLRGGSYTVRAIDNVTGCFASRTTRVTNDPVQILLQDSLSAQTNCVAFNGEIFLTGILEDSIQQPITGYDFFLLDSSYNVLDSSLPFDNLVAGTYFLRGTDSDSTGCTSISKKTIIRDSTVVPEILFAVDTSTTCDEIASPNGAIFADVSTDGTFSGYNYVWTEGDFTFNDTLLINNDTVLNIASGFYTLTATDTISQCAVTESVELIKSPNKIDVEILDMAITAQTYCEPNGIAEITEVLVDSTSITNFTDFSFSWFDDNGTNLDPGNTSNMEDSLAAGIYGVRARQLSTSCFSIIEDFTVADSITYPTVTFDIYANTSCDTTLRNGSLVANAATGSTLNTYGFDWYTGGVPVSGASFASTDSIASLWQGTYSVEVFDSLTSCLTTESVNLNRNILNFGILAVNTTDQTICAPVGEAEVTRLFYGTDTVNGGFSDYTFDWKLSDQSLLVDDTVANDIAGLGAGSYLVEATHTPTNCSSGNFIFDIDDVSVDPTPNLTAFTNTACNDTLDNGLIVASALTAGVDNGYSYQWYQGGLPLSSTVFSTNDSISDLTEGTYSVRITDGLTNCTATASAVISPETLELNIVNFIANDQTYCVGNGSAEVTEVSYDNTSFTNPYQNFEFTWFDESSTSLPTTIYQITDLVAGNYSVRVIHEPTQCASPEVGVNINETPVLPEATFATYVNTACVDSLANGSLAITATTPIAGLNTNYQYQWFSGASPVNMTDSITSLTFSDSLSNLNEGTYTVRIIDAVTTCENFATVALNLEEADSIFITDLNTIAQTVCEPAVGEIDVLEVNDQGSIYSGTGLNNYNFNLFDQNLGQIDTAVSPVSEFTSLYAGTYFVQAINRTNGCASGRRQVSVVDQIPAIDTDYEYYPNTACDTTNLANGAIAISATTNGINNGYVFNWLGEGVAADSIFNLAPGEYVVQVYDSVTQCTVIDSVTLNDDAIDIDISDAGIVVTDQTDLNPPNGALQVIEVIEDGLTISPFPGPYEFYYYDIDSVLIDSLTLIADGLQAGTYFIAARNTSTDCISGQTQAEVEYEVEDPDVLVDILPNTACDITLSNGQLSASVNENGNPVITGYTYTWYSGEQPITSSSTVVSNQNVATNLAAGRYTLVVSDTITPNLGAVDTVTLTMYDSTTLPSIEAYLATDLEICFPVGELQVIDMSYGDTTDFNYSWYDEIYPAGLNASVSAASYSNLAAGTYYAEATDISTGCTSLPTQMLLEDNSENPDIRVVSFNPNTRCDPNNPNGSITVTAREFDGSGSTEDYAFSWFDGLNNTSTPWTPSTDITGSQNQTINNVGNNFFTVRAFNDSTGCSVTENIAMTDSLPAMRLNISASPNTRCIDPNNGRASANIIQPKPSLPYTYYWFNGTGFTANDINNSDYVADNLAERVWTDLQPGDYTVIAIDNSDPFCVSDPTVVQVGDSSKLPNITIVENNPLTRCYENLANGQLEASIGGSILGYNFTWVRGGQNSADTISNGPVASGLSAEEYTVIVLNNHTGCVNTESQAVNTNFEPVPEPQVAIEAEQRSCLDPNGAASAEVPNQLNSQYTFNWYDDGDDLLGTGGSIGGLNEGDYSVSTILISSGCESSARDTFSIATNITYPEYEVEFEKASCNEFNGTAQIVLTNDVRLGQVIWRDEMQNIVSANVGSRINNLEAGLYSVNVITDQGCEQESEFRLKTNIDIYNLVTVNNDGFNDHFTIDCIEQFPGNVVRIYNRAGALVYEGRDYDNIDNFFNGRPNSSLALGTELPSGTYFYIIDLSDGSEIKSGYLEIIR